MRNRILYSLFIVVVVALAMAPAVFGQDARAAQLLEASRQAIGAQALDGLRTLSVEAALQRNLNTMQISSDVEMLLELPDKYARIEQPNAPGMIAGAMTSGFNGDRPLQPVQGGFAGGGLVIRMGGPSGPPPDLPKPTPEEQERIEKSVVRSHKHELSRLMLGWFAAAHPSVAPQYAYAGEAESPDGRAHVIDVTGTDGFAARLFIDQRTHLPLMVSYKAAQRQIVMAGGPGRGGAGGAGHGGVVVAREGARPMSEEERKRLPEDAQQQIAALQKAPPPMVDYTLYFEDWQSADGLRFPRTVRRASEGTTTEEWTVGTVKVNPKIDAKKFEVER
jgi:hypothetical protein